MYIVSPLLLWRRWAPREAAQRQWRHTGDQTLQPGNFNHRSATSFFFPSIVAREQVSQTIDILGCVCVVFLVGRGADQGVQSGTLGLFY